MGIRTGVPWHRMSNGRKGLIILGWLTKSSSKKGSYRKRRSSTSNKQSKLQNQPSMEYVLPGTTPIVVRSPVDPTLITRMNEINERLGRSTYTSTIIWITLFLCIILWAVSFPILLTFIVGAIGFGTYRHVKNSEKSHKISTLSYDNEHLGTEFSQINCAFEELQQVKSIFFRAYSKLPESKMENQDNTRTKLFPTKVGRIKPPYIETNINIQGIETPKLNLYFFPDGLYAFFEKGYSIIPYSLIKITYEVECRMEDGVMPLEVEKAGETWLYTRKDGGPDRRRKDNRLIPIGKYGVVGFIIDGKPTIHLYVSNTKKALAFCTQINQVIYNEPTNLVDNENTEGERTKGLQSQQTEPCIPQRPSVKIKPKLELIEHKLEFDDGMQYVVGKIRNNSDRYYNYIKIEVIFFDEDGNQVWVDIASTSKLRPGGTWRFKVDALDHDVKNYEIEITQADCDENVLLQQQEVFVNPTTPKPKLIEHKLEFDGGMEYVVGKIRNNSDRYYNYIEVEVIFFDEDGNQVWVDIASTSKLRPGGTWKFKVDALDHDVKKYEIEVTQAD